MRLLQDPANPERTSRTKATAAAAMLAAGVAAVAALFGVGLPVDQQAIELLLDLALALGLYFLRDAKGRSRAEVQAQERPGG